MIGSRGPPAVIARAQFQVGEQSAFAAQSAVWVKLFNPVYRHRCFGYFRASSDLIFGYCSRQKLAKSCVTWIGFMPGVKMWTVTGTRPSAIFGVWFTS